MEKKCHSCKVTKNVADFNNNRNQKDGLQGACRACTRKAANKYWGIHKAKPKPIEKQGYKVCTECNHELLYKEYSKLKAGKFGLASRCKHCTAEKYKSWREEKGGKSWENSYVKARKQKDPQYKLKSILRLRLLDAFKRHINGGTVSNKHSARELLGCDINTALLHIEQQFLPEMNWQNHGKVWELDHIRPCASYNLLSELDVRECFNYKNLQPLFKTSSIATSLGYVGYVGNRNKQAKY